MYIELPEIRIRKVLPDDLDAMHVIYTQPDNMKFISSGRSDWTREEILKKYEESNRNYDRGFGLYVVEHLLSGQVIGEAGIFNSFRDLKILELGYIIDRQWWGRGYGTQICQALIDYCFNTLGANKVVARMYAGNTGSVKVSEKTGMKRVEEGTTPDGRSFYRYEIEKQEE
ncbi:MAG: GNAT family N-acetyltransferase [Tannerellaceae bacterium]|nr:GNAT family N-acetyltransferase [Tannerellaceae bacterium]